VKRCRVFLVASCSQRDMTAHKKYALFILINFAFIETADALMCMPQTAQEIVKNAEVAFVGMVTSIEDSAYKPRSLCQDRAHEKPHCGGKILNIRVTENLRGSAEDTAIVIAEDSCYCTGIRWNIGSSYIVVARKNTSKIAGQFIALDICSGTSAVNENTPALVREFKAKK
jgi:hypothetical protein